MRTPIQVTKTDLQKYLVSYHHLTESTALKSPCDILTYMEKVGCIQYDPINVLAPNSHLVFQARYTSYQPEILNSLLYKTYELMDGWDKNLSIYRTVDHPLYDRYRQRFQSHRKKLPREIQDAMSHVLDRIRKEGPLSSSDFKDTTTIDWWWAPAKVTRAALDQLFLEGHIYVHHKVNTRKYYDLIERHNLYDTTLLTASSQFNCAYHDTDSYYRWHIMRRIQAVGLLAAKRASYAYIAIDGLKASDRLTAVERLVSEERIVPLNIEGTTNTYYIPTDFLTNLLAIIYQADSERSESPVAKIIAPLDNLIWDRDMIKDIFDFDYKWEVYEPVHKRQYGYYVIPILYGHKFIGRFVGRMDRDNQRLLIDKLYFEEDLVPDDQMINALGLMFLDFAESLGASNIKIQPTCNNKKWVGAIKKRYTFHANGDII